jgi:2-polyprenyl-3-methyl-5-hydroxy-6-metoxy-1,4-benzoquinol methylase
MSSQVEYYNQFGNHHRDSILKCPEPEVWTTDYDKKGRVYQEIKHRIDQQIELIKRYFSNDCPVLDIGCGFGRQAIILAKLGYTVTGIDTSPVFIDIAKELFKQHGYKGDFICSGVDNNLIGEQHRQILLLDVLEHITPPHQKNFLFLVDKILARGGVLIISVPHVKRRITSKLNNAIRKRITQHFSFFLQREEHPYPIPGKHRILKLCRPYFSLTKFIESEQTDYYVFQKKV